MAEIILTIQNPRNRNCHPVVVAVKGWMKFEIRDNRYNVPVEALNDEFPLENKMSILKSLVRRYERLAVPILIEALRDSEWMIRYEAAIALGYLGDRTAVPALIQLLRDSKSCVRTVAAGALGKLQDPEAVPALIEALEDRDSWVREAACSALGNIRDRRAVPALISKLQEDRDKYVRKAACWALGHIGDPKAIPYLKAAAEKDKRIVRFEARQALKAIFRRLNKKKIHHRASSS